ncbi:NADH dehydrogenase [ubiquinone] 1 alpha subcomplex subunit 13 [Pseudomyrmex gracilis]|uniref:NADH dehydrogenase [ubiquinone] 1 alpha subcomplex subunit 13 n=1 Tax=Pseudomyrmex gracilis TaxID=219809 RepID=UPI0009959A9A|nr:NADH dehydrogenase [ubiquinone] 1 alpha subcomplex subunit 13 [Pseudomyrmex gracilis]XP_020282716.1 NADH dehydrogenase [ubiquinone] 1 alpha subcomplex subunit 13 [Pseudomyrmex gracilis]
MSATAKQRLQDLPPKGGYGPIQTDRVKLRSILGAKSSIALFIAASSYGLFAYYLTFLRNRRNQIEMRSARFAIWPALIAERDRAVLKQMRRNRDEEAELMKNVKGWEVGTYYGEPIYYLDDKDQYREPLFLEHFAHGDPAIVNRRAYRHLFT